jgi:uncharacterized protein (DUF1697 family)
VAAVAGARARRYVALLGGINVGGHRVTMAGLRASFEALGFSGVSAYIASGNVIFDARTGDVSGLEQRLERHLGGALGFPVPTFIRTAQEVRDVAAYEPFPPESLDGGYHALMVLFLAHALDAAGARRLLDFRTPVDDLHVHGREVYWLRRTPMSGSLVDWRRVGKTIAMPRGTTRNVTTVRNLARTLSASG